MDIPLGGLQMALSFDMIEARQILHTSIKKRTKYKTESNNVRCSVAQH